LLQTHEDLKDSQKLENSQNRKNLADMKAKLSADLKEVKEKHERRIKIVEVKAA
jgi:hypothetical protein